MTKCRVVCWEGWHERGLDELALDPPPVLTSERDSHWLDRFDRAWKGHLWRVEAVRDRLMAEALPPDTLFAAGCTRPGVPRGRGTA
jgi:hypothetical protein